MREKSSMFLDVLNEYLNEYLVQQKGCSLNTQRSYKYTFRLLLEFFYTVKETPSDKLQFSDLTYDNINEFLNWLENTRKCSPTTRNQRLAALRSFSSYAQIRCIDASTMFRSSVLKLVNKKTVSPDISYFTRDEVKYLLESIENNSIGSRNRVIITFMYASGARAQETCDLKVKDITFAEDKAIVILHGKGRKSRRISLSEKPSKILADYIKIKHGSGSKEDFVFSSQVHKNMSVSCIEEIYKKYIAIAKNNHPECFRGKYSPHSMRHTTATHMVEAGIPLLVIKNFLGHSSVETTQVYAKVTEQHYNTQISKWNEQWLQPISNDRTDNCPIFLR